MTTWDSVWQKFHSLFEFRREGAGARPPLGADEATYLRLNLALMLQTAELALLRNDAAVYQQSLGSVREWLDDYLDTGDLAVAGVGAEIDQLLELRLDRPLPDISASLAALRPLLDAKPASAETSAVPQVAPDAVDQVPAARESLSVPVEPGDGE
jgi:uroporphyrin-3 C-methyltransferase